MYKRPHYRGPRQHPRCRATSARRPWNRGKEAHAQQRATSALQCSYGARMNLPQGGLDTRTLSLYHFPPEGQLSIEMQHQVRPRGVGSEGSALQEQNNARTAPGCFHPSPFLIRVYMHGELHPQEGPPRSISFTDYRPRAQAPSSPPEAWKGARAQKTQAKPTGRPGNCG